MKRDTFTTAMLSLIVPLVSIIAGIAIGLETHSFVIWISSTLSILFVGVTLSDNLKVESWVRSG